MLAAWGTLDHLKLVCRHVVEMRSAGITENFAIRMLEQFANNYAKFRVLNHCSPDHVDQFTHWSKAARKAKAANPKGAPGTYLRVEHGTPRRDFARDVLEAYKAGKLTEQWMEKHCNQKWKIAVITQEEDRRLNKFKGQKFISPDQRWAAAKIEF
jgi:hypothetical protein